MTWYATTARRGGWVGPSNMNPTADRFYRSLSWQLLRLTCRSVVRACWNHLLLKRRGKENNDNDRTLNEKSAKAIMFWGALWPNRCKPPNLKGPCAQAAILTCSHQGALVALKSCVFHNHKLPHMEKNSTLMQHHLLALVQSCHAPGDQIACFESYLNTLVPFRAPPHNTLLGYFFLTNGGRATEGSSGVESIL